MKSGAKTAVGIAIIAAVAAGAGYWVGHGSAGRPDIQKVAASGGAAPAERKVLFYRNPMGLPDTSPVPKKDPMGMDYIPVYQGEEEGGHGAANEISISTAKVQKLGVRTEKAAVRSLEKIVRAAGRVEADERRTYVVSPKFEGYVERLHVNVTGQPVKKGQPLFEVYSPELVSAQREYVIAAQGVALLSAAGSDALEGMKQLADASLARLRNWDISDEQIRALVKAGSVKRTMTFRSPASGIITAKKAVQGMRFMPGEALYQVADLSTVWVLADVSEQDIGLLATGATAEVRINAYPDKVFAGKVTYVYPIVNPETRTAQARIELTNADQLLKPGMYASVGLSARGKAPAVTVPLSAVIDSGTRQLVLVQRKEGRYEPREVKLGARNNDYVEVLQGIADGDSVVVSANFLIDAESNLKAAIGSFGEETGAAAAADASHKAAGTVEQVDPDKGTVSIHHGPVASVKWPAMTMEFAVANKALLSQLKPGVQLNFEFVERNPGEFVITSVQATSANPHAGH